MLRTPLCWGSPDFDNGFAIHNILTPSSRHIDRHRLQRSKSRYFCAKKDVLDIFCQFLSTRELGAYSLGRHGKIGRND